jgi:apolipoprotein N-acyltransferase
VRRLSLHVALVLASAAALALCARMERPSFALIFVALAPWLAALERARTLRAALASAWLLSLAMAATIFAWFADAIAAYTGAPLALAWLVLLALAPVLEPQLLVFAAVRHRARRAGALAAALAGASAWVGAEWALPKLFADSLGHAFLPAPWLRQAADLAGVGGLTLAVLLANECALAAGRALAARRPRAALAPAALAAALVAGLAGYGALRLRALEAELARAPHVTAGIVQADIARYGELLREASSFDVVAGILESHFALSQRALAQAPLDLLLWPETVYPTTFGAPKSPDGAAFDRALGAFVLRTGVPLVFGAYDAEGGREYNAAVFLEADGAGRVRFGTYRKAALFPLTERVPRWLDGPRARALLPWLGSWAPGAGERSLPLKLAGRAARVAPLICYDALDPALVHEAVREGAELIVTLSNDSWFAFGEGPRLHLAMAAFRSLETRRAQLRATPTGISAAISPAGEVTAQLGVHARDVLVARVPLLASRPGLFARAGDWLGPAAALCAAASTLVTPRGTHRRKPPGGGRRGGLGARGRGPQAGQTK